MGRSSLSIAQGKTHTNGAFLHLEIILSRHSILSGFRPEALVYSPNYRV